jgi:glutathione S-transferase
MLAPQFEYLAMTPEGGRLLAPHAGLRAWLARMQARESMQATTPERLSQRFARAA